MNRLMFGDCLVWLRQLDADSADMIYLDPPFNSDRVHNVLFKSPSGDRSAQNMAFDDTWTWGEQSAAEFTQLVHGENLNVAEAIRSFRQFLGDSDVMAYLVMMAIRLVELRRVLKPKGLLFLHCDPTASHYLKVIMDTIFGGDRYVNEIIWRRTGAHNSTRSFGAIHDVIHVYSKRSGYNFNIVRRPYMRKHVEKRYRNIVDGVPAFSSGGNVLSGAGKSGGESGQIWRGFDPSSKDRHWAIPRFYEKLMPPEYKNLTVTQKLDALYQEGLITVEDGKEWPTMIRLLGERDGQPVQDIWAYQPYTEETVFGTTEGIDADVKWWGPSDPRRFQYPTEKPPGLLGRIIEAGSNEGETVLDPFCGCGWAIHVAELAKRNWIGIDISPQAIDLVERRIRGEFPATEFTTEGFPTDIDGAKKLADTDKYAFQQWANAMVGARDFRRGADGGIDGIRYFQDIHDGVIVERKVIVSVKGGANVTPEMVKGLQKTVEDNAAHVGIMVTLNPPTKGMKQQALRAGHYISQSGRRMLKTQILTADDLLPPNNRRPDLPDPIATGDTTFKTPKAIDRGPDNLLMQELFPSGAPAPPKRPPKRPGKKRP